MRKSRLEEQREDLGVNKIFPRLRQYSATFLCRFDVVLKKNMRALLRARLSNARPGVRMLSLVGGATQG